MDDDHDGLLTRRRLLATGVSAVASVVLLDASASASTPVAGAAQAKPLPGFSRTGYRRSRFAPHVGTPVTLRPPGRAAIRATLAGVDDAPNVKSLAGDEDVYTLRFRAPAAAVLAEGIVGICHTDFGTVKLYVSPAPAAGGTRDYLASINRRVPRRVARRVL